MIKILDFFQAGKSAGDNFKMLQSENVWSKLIYRTLQIFKETGSLKDRARSNRPHNIMTRGVKEKIKKRIVRNPRRT